MKEAWRTAEITDQNASYSHHFSFPFLGDSHLFEHLGSLLHDQSPLVGVIGYVGILELDDVHLSLDPTRRDMFRMLGRRDRGEIIVICCT